MNPTIASVILLGLNVLLFIYTLSPTISPPITLILLIMAVVLLANIYKVGTEYVSLEEDAQKNKRIIAQQKKEIQANQEKLKEILEELTRKDKGKIKEELAKLSSEEARRTEQFRVAYWDKLEKVSVAAETEEGKKLKELSAKRDEIEGLIELSRKKYMKRQLDEESLKEIVRDYQKDLIEIEGEIKKLRKESPVEKRGKPILK